MAYDEIKRVLGACLNQDYKEIFGSLTAAVTAAVAMADYKTLTAELDALAIESDEVVQAVLDDHEVDLWDLVRPSDFLVTLRTLADLG